jgi:hypothetical protein
MSNTIIQIKRSLTSGKPASLSVAELGYSYQSNTFYIGTPDGTGTIAIGGKAPLDLINASFDIANAAYTAANGAGSLAVINLLFQTANAGFDMANGGFTVANAAYGFANSTYSNYAYPAYVRSSAAFDRANGGFTVANAAFGLANTLAVSSNAYATAVGAAGNAYANLVGASANAYTDSVGSSSRSYANNTFVKLVAGSQTITGDLAFTGNLTFLGNSTVITSSQLSVGDSLIYLAANNYSGTDFLDIGFIANYGNTTGANVHTGLVRDATDKTYYLFNGYDQEPANNTFVPYGNNMSLAVLNADLVTSNLTLGGANAIIWIKSAYDNSNAGYTVANAAYGQVNTLATSANAYAAAVGISANAYAVTVGGASNTFAVSVGASANAYAVTVGATSNAYANVVGVSSNAYANVVGASSNAYVNVSTASANSYANSLNTVIFQTFSDASNLSSGIVPSARLSGSYTGITGVGTITTGSWRGSTIPVGHGGTGIVSATLNGVLYGSGGNAAFQVTNAGTEGQVLTASATGVPQFEMISGGTF